MGSTGGFRGDIVPKGYRAGQLGQYTPEQRRLYRQSFEHLAPDSYLARLAGGDESLFNEMEAPAMKQFSEMQGGLASRFSGFGMGARNSSGFQNTMNQAAQDFATQLQSRRQDLMRQALNDMMGYTNMLLEKRPYQRFMEEKPQKDNSALGGWGGLLGGIGGGIAGSFFGNPVAGATIGANAFSGL